MPLDSASPCVLSPVARWRWWLASFLMGFLPVLIALSNFWRVSPDGEARAMLPATVPGLLWFCALQFGTFALLWAIFWALTRANREQLFLSFRGVKSLCWGVAYSLLMRFGLILVAIVVLILLSLFGFDSKTLFQTLQSNSENLKEAFAPALISRDPLYRFLLITLVSFGVAGLREELWRVATLAGIFHLAPQAWSQNRKNGVALGVSSAIFGISHLYQGITGVLGTTLLGLVLGAITLRHKSVWPAIVAHGCFDAASFAALSALGAAK